MYCLSLLTSISMEVHRQKHKKEEDNFENMLSQNITFDKNQGIP